MENFNFKKLYFIGAGGIGMANLVRFFISKGYPTAGYDRTPSQLTSELESEGCTFTFTDSEEQIPADFRNNKETLVVYTPAVPADNKIFTWFKQHDFRIIKRAALLGEITRNSEAICVAGSHGKTTVSTMTAHILQCSETECNAFLGGIARNYGSNLLLSEKSPYSVVEADEYDRSFHHLTPYIAVVTSTDPDHLDIYGNEENYLEGFAHFTSLIKPGGYLILHTGLKMIPRTNSKVTTLTYSATDCNADYHAQNIHFEEGRLYFDLITPTSKIEKLELGVPIEINVDNAIAASAAAMIAGATEKDIREGLLTFLGAKRRFEIWLRPEECGTLLIDDYAHSPNEIKASIKSVGKAFPNRKISVIFQPHLYTRTRDFAKEFAEALSAADEVILPEIYPARELPIDGVDSQMILRDVDCEKKIYCERKDLLNLIKNSNFEILMTLGAADIDRLLPQIKEILTSRVL